MVMPSLVVVMLGPSALVADVGTVATLTLLVLAGVVFSAGSAWNRHERGRGPHRPSGAAPRILWPKAPSAWPPRGPHAVPDGRDGHSSAGATDGWCRPWPQWSPMAIRPSDRSILNRTASTAATLVLAIGIVHAADAPSGVVVNGQALPAATVRTLEQAYRVPIAPGRYWYDAVSGAWGLEGGPIAGQMMPGLRLGGPLAADASRGNSRVFINGRELMVGEV